MIPSAIRYLMEGGHQAPSPDNSQPWLFTWNEGILTVRFDKSGPIAEVFGPQSHCETLTMGAVVENVVQLAQSLPLDGEWKISRTGPTYLQFKPASVLDRQDLPSQNAIFTRQTNRFKFKTLGLSQDAIRRIEHLSEGGCTLHVVVAPEKIKRIAGLVRLASSLRFRNQRLHEWFDKSLRFTPDDVDQGNGLDVATLDLPPGGASFLKLIMDWQRMRRLNRIGLYHVLSFIEARAIANAPGMLVIAGPRDESFDAGRLMERVWLELERSKVAVHPYYVVTDQLIRYSRNDLPSAIVHDAAQLDSATSEFLGKGIFPHMLLRFGRPSKTAFKSKRQPLEHVIRFDP